MEFVVGKKNTLLKTDSKTNNDLLQPKIRFKNSFFS